MSDDKKPEDGGARPVGQKPEAQLRREREAAALRANLQRRKQQARSRRDAGGRQAPEDGSAGA